MKRKQFFSAAFIAAILTVMILSLNACKKSNDTAVVPATLYDSLGGTAMVSDPANSGTKIEAGRLGLRSVTDSAIFVIAADPKLNGFFKVLLAEVSANNTSGFVALSKNVTDFFCVATGAKNFTYTGKNMMVAHDPAQNSRMNGKASSADFDQFVADLVIAANKNKVPSNLINSIGNLVNTTRGMVVQR